MRQTAETGHVEALSVGVEIQQLIIDFDGLCDGEAVQFSLSERAAWGTRIFQEDSESPAADSAVTNHGSRLFDSLFHGVFQDDAWRMIIVEHGPVGRFAEVFERSTIGFELDRWADGSRISLFVISSFSVDIYHLSVVIRMNLDESVLHDEPFQFLLARQRFVATTSERSK